MKIQIHTEGFRLTEAIRSYTETCTLDAFSNFPEKFRIEAFLRKEGHDSYSCTLKAKVWRKNFVFKEYGPDLYTLITEAHKGLIRNVHKVKEKRKALVHKRAAYFKSLLPTLEMEPSG